MNIRKREKTLTNQGVADSFRVNFIFHYQKPKHRESRKFLDYSDGKKTRKEQNSRGIHLKTKKAATPRITQPDSSPLSLEMKQGNIASREI